MMEATARTARCVLLNVATFDEMLLCFVKHHVCQIVFVLFSASVVLLSYRWIAAVILEGGAA